MKILLGLALVTSISLLANAQETKIKMGKVTKKAPASTALEAPAKDVGTSAATLSDIVADLQPEATNEAMALANYYPAKGKKVAKFAPSFSAGSTSYNNKTVSQSSQVSGLITEVNYQARVNQDLALEFYTTFGSEDSSSTTKSKQTGASSKYDSRQSGLSDLHIVAKNLRQQGAGNVILAADLGLSASNAEFGTRNNDGNRMSGGLQLAPSLSYEQVYKNRIIGWKGQVNLKADRSAESRTSGQVPAKYTLTGGNELSGMAFNEWQSRNGVVGVSGKVAFVTDSAIEQAGQPTQSTDPFQLMTFSLYGQKTLSKTATLLPSLGFSTLLNKGSGNVDGFDVLTVGLGARIAL